MTSGWPANNALWKGESEMALLNIFFVKHFTGSFVYDIEVKTHYKLMYYPQFIGRNWE